MDGAPEHQPLLPSHEGALRVSILLIYLRPPENLHHLGLYSTADDLCCTIGPRNLLHNCRLSVWACLSHVEVFLQILVPEALVCKAHLSARFHADVCGFPLGVHCFNQ